MTSRERDRQLQRARMALVEALYELEIGMDPAKALVCSAVAVLHLAPASPESRVNELVAPIVARAREKPVIP